MGPLSLDLRVRIVEAYENGEGSVRDIAERFMVSPTTVQNYRKLLSTTGRVLPRLRRGVYGRKIEDALLRPLLEEKDTWTLDELAAEYARRHGGDRVARSTMSQAVRRLEWTRKKLTSHPSERDRPDVQRQRADFADQVGEESPPRGTFFSMKRASISAWADGTAGLMSASEPKGRCP